MSKPKKFGAGSMADEHGYDLDLLVGWLETIVDHEDSNAKSKKRRALVDKAYDALGIFQDILNETGE